VLGVDPSLRSTGYGVVDYDDSRFRLVEAGTITTRASDGLAGRLGDIAESLAAVIAATQPVIMVVEEVFARSVNPKTTIMMAHARGAALGAAAARGLQVHEFAATTVKRALVGSGSASKGQVAKMVVRLLGLRREPKPADVTDALAMAIAFAHRNGRGH
jgi:crossover junction endodeoxyribonuclease RuvC